MSLIRPVGSEGIVSIPCHRIAPCIPLISLPFHTADWAVLFCVLEIKCVLPDLCEQKIALGQKYIPTIYWKIMEFLFEVTNQPVCSFSMCKASRPTF